MDFREEYKKSAEVMTPSAEAMERMTKNIMEQINAPAKKAIPFKKISYIGGAIAACAVITVGAVKLLPSMQTELATADAAAYESAAAMGQDNAVAVDEYTPVNGVRADADSAYDTKSDMAMDIAEEAEADDKDIFDYFSDAVDNTTAITTPPISAGEDSAIFEDKTFADNADAPMADDAEEEVKEEGESPAAPDVADEVPADSVQSVITDSICVADDMQSFSIGDKVYVQFPQEWSVGALPEEISITYYAGADGKQYKISDHGDLKLLTCEDFSAFYCTQDIYDELLDQQQ